tara:strand:- start:449 stop:991 length:543 start_codon:yes stop_codon:yes gene_type:complete
MVNYQNGKIYAIKSNSGDKLYVGSTTKDYLSKRMAEHRRAFTAWEKGNGKRCMSHELFSQYGVENCYIELIELFPCNTRDELATRENHYIRSLVCVNKYLAINPLTKKERAAEYYEKRSEYVKRHVAEYREKNIEAVRRREAAYRAENIEAIRLRDRIRSKRKNAWNAISREFRAILNED